jgi:hypothetical protein
MKIKFDGASVSYNLEDDYGEKLFTHSSKDEVEFYFITKLMNENVVNFDEYSFSYDNNNNISYLSFFDKTDKERPILSRTLSKDELTDIIHENSLKLELIRTLDIGDDNILVGYTSEYSEAPSYDTFSISTIQKLFKDVDVQDFEDNYVPYLEGDELKKLRDAIYGTTRVLFQLKNNDTVFATPNSSNYLDSEYELIKISEGFGADNMSFRFVESSLDKHKAGRDVVPFISKVVLEQIDTLNLKGLKDMRDECFSDLEILANNENCLAPSRETELLYLDNLVRNKMQIENTMSIEDKVATKGFYGSEVAENVSVAEIIKTIDNTANSVMDMNINRRDSGYKYQKLNGEQMFNDRVGFEEIANDSEYFYENKEGLKAIVVKMPPSDYIKAVELRQSDHKEYGASEDKLDNLRLVYEEGILVDIPDLSYGSRDVADNYFTQEGYNRAVTAQKIDKENIPVAIRYREEDKNIPDFILKYIKNNQLEIINKRDGLVKSNEISKGTTQEM